MQNEKFQQINIISFSFISKSIYINFHPFGHSIFLFFTDRKGKNIPTDEINYGKSWNFFADIYLPQQQNKIHHFKFMNFSVHFKNRIFGIFYYWYFFGENTCCVFRSIMMTFFPRGVQEIQFDVIGRWFHDNVCLSNSDVMWDFLD